MFWRLCCWCCWWWSSCQRPSRPLSTARKDYTKSSQYEINLQKNRRCRCTCPVILILNTRVSWIQAKGGQSCFYHDSGRVRELTFPKDAHSQHPPPAPWCRYIDCFTCRKSRPDASVVHGVWIVWMGLNTFLCPGVCLIYQSFFPIIIQIYNFYIHAVLFEHRVPANLIVYN